VLEACRESLDSSQVVMKQFQLDCHVMLEEHTLKSEAKLRAAMAEETGRLRVALEIGGEANEVRVRDLVAEQATSLRGILTEQNKQCEYLAHFQWLHEQHQRHHEDSSRFREGLQTAVKLIEEQLWQLQVAPAEAVELRLRDIEAKIDPVEAQLHDHVKRQQTELSDSHEHLKVLHEKLQSAVVKGYEAVDAKFRELLGEQVSMLKLELGQASEAQRALQVAGSATGLAEACEYTDKRQKELQVVISALREDFRECFSKHIKHTDGLERRLDETAQQSKLQMQELPDALATRSQVLLEKHGQTCMARVSDSERHFEKRHAELELVVAGGAEALTAKLHENVMQHRADHQQQFALQCQALEDRLCELNAKHEVDSLNQVEQRYHELQDALSQHACGQTKRLDEMNEQIVAVVDNVHQAVEQRLNLQLNKLSEQSQQDGLRFVSKECAHRLHALAYSLLEIIGEVELAGSLSEIREKRMKLHKRVCDRLGAAPSWSAAVSGTTSQEYDPDESVRPGSAHVRNKLQRLWEDPPLLVDFGQGPVSLPKMEQVAPLSRSSTPRSDRRTPQTLREARMMRFDDFASLEYAC